MFEMGPFSTKFSGGAYHLFRLAPGADIPPSAPVWECFCPSGASERLRARLRRLGRRASSSCTSSETTSAWPVSKLTADGRTGDAVSRSRRPRDGQDRQSRATAAPLRCGCRFQFGKAEVGRSSLRRHGARSTLIALSTDRQRDGEGARASFQVARAFGTRRVRTVVEIANADD